MQHPHSLSYNVAGDSNMMAAKRVIDLEAIGPDNHVMCLPIPKLGQSALREKLGK